MTKLFTCGLLLLLTHCNGVEPSPDHQHSVSAKSVISSLPDARVVADISTPSGFTRSSLHIDSFGAWLRRVALKSDHHVFLYNGQLKRNQSAQFAVLDIPVGTKDLQQCADAIMRLRAEYFLSKADYHSISFRSSSGTELSFVAWLRGTRYRLSGNTVVPYVTNVGAGNMRAALEQYLEFVFSYCGTYSLFTQLHESGLKDLTAGDVFVKAGAPGHAMIVMDVAENEDGEKMFLLAQSYMPAQDIHIVKNPAQVNDPWYSAEGLKQLITPEWIFRADELRKW